MALAVMVTEAVKYGPLIFVSMLIASTGAAKVVSEGSAAILPQMLPSLVILFAVGVYTACTVVLTTYAYPAVANGASWHAAIGQSIAACWMFPGETIAYMFLRALSSIAVASLSLLAGLLSVQVSSLLSTLASFVVVPVLHTLKAAIFIRREPVPVVIPILPGPSLIRDAPRHILDMSSQRIVIGIRELSHFVLSAQNIPFHVLSTATFIIGIIAGLQVSSSGLSALLRALGYEIGSVNPAFQGLALPFLAADISFHNWQVSLATALSGLALLIPPFVTMMFNGFMLGVVGSLVPNPTMLLAAILPHGIIELPSFITAGSVGLSLAFKFTKALIRGKVTTDDGVHSAVKRAIYVIIGLAPFFIMAGIIEALVTPFIMRYYGWG